MTRGPSRHRRGAAAGDHHARPPQPDRPVDRRRRAARDRRAGVRTRRACPWWPTRRRAELRIDGPRRAARSPPTTPARVVTIGSMSKSAWGGLRIGWIRASPRLIRELAAVRADLDMASPVLEQLLALELLAALGRGARLPQRAAARPRRDALLEALAARPGWTVRRPERRPERLGPPARARRHAPRAAAARERARSSPRGRRSASTARSSATCGCRSARAPDVLRNAVRTLQDLAGRLGASTVEALRAPPTAV